jgi:hypothetical protein
MLVTSLGVVGCGERAKTLRVKIDFLGVSDRISGTHQNVYRKFIVDSSPSVM